jgi:hypothetical protein
MQTVNPQSQHERLTRILDESWEILAQRIATGRVSINKEASLQLHYSSILLSYGELLCVEPRETFTIELESASGRKSIDIKCTLGETRAAIELKCFRKASNRACDIDMYDVWYDLERLLSYQEFAVRKFICLTDNPYYVCGVHSGHAGSVSIRNGTILQIGSKIAPSWAGKWKDKSRDRCLTFAKSVELHWNQNRGWYSLALTL